MNQATKTDFCDHETRMPTTAPWGSQALCSLVGVVFDLGSPSPGLGQVPDSAPGGAGACRQLQQHKHMV